MGNGRMGGRDTLRRRKRKRNSERKMYTLALSLQLVSDEKEKMFLKS